MATLNGEADFLSAISAPARLTGWLALCKPPQLLLVELKTLAYCPRRRGGALASSGLARIERMIVRQVRRGERRDQGHEQATWTR